MQFVRLVNEGDRKYDFHHQNKKRTIEPGAEVMVPWDIACTLFGDPALIDTNKDQARTRVWKQCAGIHNYSEGNMDEETWELIRPKIAVYDIESGTRVWMILEDRDGIHAGMNPSPGAVDADMHQAALMSRVSQLEGMLAKTLGLLTQMQAQTAITGQQVVASQDAGPTVVAPTQDGVPGSFPAFAPTVGDAPNGQPTITGPSEDAPPPPVAPAVSTEPTSIPKGGQPDTPQAVPTGKLAAKTRG